MPLDLLDPLALDIIGFAGSVLAVLAYHLYLRRRVRLDPSYTIQSINNAARAAWVETVMSSGNKDILAVQTLRNSTMAATFLASTSILLIIGVLNLTQQGGALGSALQSLARGPVSGPGLWTMKLLPLVVDLFWAFFAFSLAIRMFNHVGYLINVGAKGSFSTEPSYVAALLNRGGSFYSMGMRCYYLSVPLVFWLFGPLHMLVATVVLITVLYRVDRSPEAD